MEIATIDTSKFPIVVISFQPIEPSDEKIDSYLNKLRLLLEESKENVFLIYDLNQGKYMTMDGRIRMGKWTKTHSDLFKEKVMGMANVNTSIIANMVLKAFLLLVPVHMRPVLFTKMSEAIKYAEEVIEKNMAGV
jgi:hypothetical protein